MIKAATTLRAAGPRFIFVSVTQINVSLAAAVNFIMGLKVKYGGRPASWRLNTRELTFVALILWKHNTDVSDLGPLREAKDSRL